MPSCIRSRPPIRKTALEVRLLSRSNEVLATKKTDASGKVSFEANLTRGEGGSAPALLVASETKGDYAFLSLKSPAFDLSDRGVAGRRVPAGLDAFVYPERGVYRSGESVHITALLRDAQGVAATGVPLTLIVMRPDGVEYRRSVLPDQGVGGRSLSLPITASAPTGTWRVRAFTDPKQPAIGEASFMVEDYVPDRLEFDLASQSKSITRATPFEVTLDGRFLYGAPASNLDLEGEVVIAAAKERAGFPRLQIRHRRRGFGFGERAPAARQSSVDRRAGQGAHSGHARQIAECHAAAGSAGDRPHGGERRPRGRAQAHVAGRARGRDDRREAAVFRQVAE